MTSESNGQESIGPQPESPGTSVVIVATRLQLQNWLKLPRFFRINYAVTRQLKSDPGLLSYRLKSDFLHLRFSTLSVWQGDPAIDEFVWSGNHQGAIAAFEEIADRGRSVFVRWQAADAQDVSWEEARRRLSAVRSSG